MSYHLCPPQCPIDTRQELAENLLVIGGTASMRGMKHRILAEVRAAAASEQYRHRLPIASFKIHHPPAKDNYVAWLGGECQQGVTEEMCSLTFAYRSKKCFFQKDKEEGEVKREVSFEWSL